jgi:hypothetical protein
LVIAAIRPAKCNQAILPLDEAGFPQACAERYDNIGRLAGRAAAEEADHRHRWLRSRRERPRGCRRATEQRDEVAPS